MRSASQWRVKGEEEYRDDEDSRERRQGYNPRHRRPQADDETLGKSTR